MTNTICMSMENILAHRQTTLDEATNNIRDIIAEFSDISASRWRVDKLLDAVRKLEAQIRSQNMDNIRVALDELLAARNEWHDPKTKERHRDEITMTELFADLDYNISVLRHKLRPNTVISITAPVRIDGASLGECPICRRTIDSLHDFNCCRYCGSKLIWKH